MGRNHYKLTKMFDDVIKMRQLKNRRSLMVLAEYLKNASADFHQIDVIFRQLYIETFEIKRLKIGHSLLLW